MITLLSSNSKRFAYTAVVRPAARFIVFGSIALLVLYFGVVACLSQGGFQYAQLEAGDKGDGYECIGTSDSALTGDIRR